MGRQYHRHKLLPCPTCRGRFNMSQGEIREHRAICKYQLDLFRDYLKWMASTYGQSRRIRAKLAARPRPRGALGVETPSEPDGV
jgi:hypothetical protein